MVKHSMQLPPPKRVASRSWRWRADVPNPVSALKTSCVTKCFPKLDETLEKNISIPFNFQKSWDMTGSFQQKNIGVGTGFLTEFRLQNSGGPEGHWPIVPPSSGSIGLWAMLKMVDIYRCGHRRIKNDAKIGHEL